MGRATKPRRICGEPLFTHFAPLHAHDESNVIELTFDEYETINLIDGAGFDQKRCAEHMEIARALVQLIYHSARKKLADAIVNGRPLVIRGGEYKLCGYSNSCCGRGRSCCCQRSSDRVCPWGMECPNMTNLKVTDETE